MKRSAIQTTAKRSTKHMIAGNIAALLLTILYKTLTHFHLIGINSIPSRYIQVLIWIAFVFSAYSMIVIMICIVKITNKDVKDVQRQYRRSNNTK